MKCFKQMQSHAERSDRVMEPETISKNGASLKSLTSKGNMIFILFVFIAGICYAQSGEDRSFTVQSFAMVHESEYKMVPGVAQTLCCLDFSKGPFEIYTRAQSKTAETRKIKVSLFVPTKEFNLSYKNDNLNSSYAYDANHYPTTLNDLVKIKEVTQELTTEWDEYFKCYTRTVETLWDGMTDPALTDGTSLPVLDNVFSLAEDAQTGEVLTANPLPADMGQWYKDNNPFSSYRRICRYTGNFGVAFTAKENSVICDVYFISQLPVRKAIPFVGYSCALSNAKISALKESLEAAVQSFPSGTGIHDGIHAYQIFDNLSPDEDGLYHLSWEIKDVAGNWLDFGNYLNDPYLMMGLYIEGDRRETFNLGLPEYGGTFHGHGDYSPIYADTHDAQICFVPVRPLNVPDFRIVDGVLSLYLGLGSNVIIPDSVVEIGDQAFHGGHRVTDVTIPEGVKKIGEYAFSESGLYAVSIPQSVTFLGHGAFMWCYNLKTIEVKWSQPLQMSGNNILNDDDYNKIKLIVPKGTKSLYRADAHWGRFSIIEENDYTGIQPVSAEATVSVSGNQLVVNSPAAETVSAYSITGSLLYSITKPAGEKRMDIQHIQNKICIVKGSSGWVKKLILND